MEIDILGMLVSIDLEWSCFLGFIIDDYVFDVLFYCWLMVLVDVVGFVCCGCGVVVSRMCVGDV